MSPQLVLDCARAPAHHNAEAIQKLPPPVRATFRSTPLIQPNPAALPNIVGPMQRKWKLDFVLLLQEAHWPGHIRTAQMQVIAAHAGTCAE